MHSIFAYYRGSNGIQSKQVGSLNITMPASSKVFSFVVVVVCFFGGEGERHIH